MSKMAAALIAAFSVMACASAAWADGAAGDACAANLSPDGKAIYAAVVAANPTSQTLRDVVEEQARGLVMGGKISRSTGRENAVAAAECVRARLN